MTPCNVMGKEGSSDPSQDPHRSGVIEIYDDGEIASSYKEPCVSRNHAIEVDLIDLTSESDTSTYLASDESVEYPEDRCKKEVHSPSPNNDTVLSFTEVFEDSLNAHGAVLVPGDAVELQGSAKYGDILRIRHIIRNLAENTYRLSGSSYRRLRYFEGIFPKKENEVAKIAENADVLSVNQIIQKVELRLTNKPFPEARDLESDVLVCRWKYVEKPDSQVKELVIQRLAENEADQDHRIPDHDLWLRWHKASCSRPSNRSYTLGDTFSGAGGVTCGALMAGIDVKWCVELCDKASDTFELNSPATQIYTMGVDRFVDIAKDYHQVDILHVSPVCKTFSAAHTRPCASDEQNEATLFAVRSLAEKARPRIITVEQTVGLPQRHKSHFHSLMHQLIDLGFSLRAATLNFAHFGVTQERKRLIIIGSCPGSKLPEFPTPTHGPGFRPIVTINEAIRSISHRTPNQDPHTEKVLNRVPYDGNNPLRTTITCNGGEAYHPSGTRLFTIRELACIQGFPLSFVFANYGKTELRKQIGNAVPPIVYKAILDSVKRTLAEEDAAYRRKSATTEEAPAEGQQSSASAGAGAGASTSFTYNVIVLD